MPDWLVKCAIHRAISLLPGRHRWNELFQDKIARSLELDRGAFEFKLDICRKYLEDFVALNPQRGEDFVAIELGTGWYPIIPVGLYLCGCSEIWSFDIHSFLRGERLKRLLELFCEYEDTGSLKKFLPRVRSERVARIRRMLPQIARQSPAITMEKMNIHAMVQDARVTGLSPDSIDLIFSWSVLEYIPPDVLLSILKEFYRVGRRDGTMIHYVDLTDQYSKFDRAISPLNFLKFSDWTWKLLQSPFTPLSRLRIGDYRKIISEAGFTVVREDDVRVAPEQLDSLKLAPKFRGIPHQDLLVARAVLVAKKK